MPLVLKAEQQSNKQPAKALYFFMQLSLRVEPSESEVLA